MLLYELSRYQQAAVEFQKALSHDPDDSSIHTFLGSCFFYEDKYPEAEAELREGIRLSPDWSESYRILANCCFYQARAEEGHALIQTAVQLSPEDPNCFWTLSKLYTLQNNHAAALKAANQGLEINPEHVTCLQAKALALGSLHRYAEGLDIIRIALNKAPESSENHAIQGYLLYQEKQLQGASDSFKTALSLDPQNGLATAMISHAAKVETQAREQKYWRTLAIAGAVLVFIGRIASHSAEFSKSSSGYKDLHPVQSSRQLHLGSGASIEKSGCRKASSGKAESVCNNAKDNNSADSENRSFDALINWSNLQLELLSKDSTCKIPNESELLERNQLIENNKDYQTAMFFLSKEDIRQLAKAIKLKCKNTPKDLEKSMKALSLLKPKLDKISDLLYLDILNIYEALGVSEQS